MKSVGENSVSFVTTMIGEEAMVLLNLGRM
jgi:hypothetical protein